jgi:hypothetical protein
VQAGSIVREKKDGGGDGAMYDHAPPLESRARNSAERGADEDDEDGGEDTTPARGRKMMNIGRKSQKTTPTRDASQGGMRRAEENPEVEDDRGSSHEAAAQGEMNDGDDGHGSPSWIHGN